MRKREAEKPLIPILKLFTQLGIEPESTASVADVIPCNKLNQLVFNQSIFENH